MREFTHIGKRVPCSDTLPKAIGAAQYVVDLIWPGMLYGAILRSPFAHARLLHIDTIRAEKLPGIKAVGTGRVSLEYSKSPSGAETCDWW